MSLKSKIEAVIYASEEPVTLQQLVGLLGGEAQADLDELAAQQAALPLDEIEDTNGRSLVEAGTHGYDGFDAPFVQALEQGEVVGVGADVSASADSEVASVTEAAQADNAQANEATTDEASVVASFDQPAEEPSDAPPAAPVVPESSEDEKKQQRERERGVRDHIRRTVDTLIRDYAESDRGIEIREVASGFRMGTKPEYHDAVRGFVKSLKPALKLTLPALETLAVVAYKQPVTAAEISEIRGVDSAGVLGGLMTRKLIATAGRKQVIGRPMLYKTTRDFLLRFGLKDIHELPSMEEFERMAGELAEQEDLPMDGAESIIEEANARGDAEMIREVNEDDVDAEEAASNDEPADAEQAEVEAVTATPPQATAEIAAGGNSEEVREEQPAISDESDHDESNSEASAETTAGEEEVTAAE